MAGLCKSCQGNKGQLNSHHHQFSSLPNAGDNQIKGCLLSEIIDTQEKKNQSRFAPLFFFFFFFFYNYGCLFESACVYIDQHKIMSLLNLR